MNVLFEVLGISKQSFHQMLNRRRYRLEEQEQLIPLINEIRGDHPRMSARDIYFKLQPACMGRDQFERFCMDSGYRIQQLKNFRVTTNSLGVTRFPNRIKDLEVTRVNQVFVSDITYFDLGFETRYLTFIMDLYNREIVGYSESDNLRTENTTLPALHIIKERGKANLRGAIMHSDGGGQYYCKEFKALTNDLGMINSMTEEKVYENAHAERLNGIIKNNYLYPYGPNNRASLKRLLDKEVYMYNHGKPHSALNKMTPVQYKNTIDNEDNFASYLPLSKVHHHNKKSRNSSIKKVNVI
jgi:transposase InsO family protein